MPRVLGIDSSTQSTKVELRDADTGALLAHGRAPHPPTQPPRSEQDPEAWWQALHGALGAAGITLRDADAIAVAGQQHGMVALDAQGAVIRPAKLWNDTESAPDAQWLHDRLGGAAAWAQACGSVPLAAFTITKLSWLHRSEPDAWARLARICLPHDYLTHRLTGAFVTDRGDASGTGYWSPHTGAYALDLLAVVDADHDWSNALPRVCAPLEVVPTPAPHTDVASRAIVAPGTGDNMAAALGLGLRPGATAVSIGTSGTVFTVSLTPTADPTGAVAGFADATGAFLPLVCTLNAAKVTDAVRGWLGATPEEFDTLARAPHTGDVVCIPWFDGERTPDRPDATGSFVGLRPHTTREQLAAAAVHGVVCGLLAGLDALASAGADTGSELLLVGGGARSAAYRHALADLAQRPVRISAADELVALGACVQAASVLHQRHATEVRDAWSIGSDVVVEPTPGSTDRSAEIRARYAAAVATA